MVVYHLTLLTLVLFLLGVRLWLTLAGRLTLLLLLPTSCSPHLSCFISRTLNKSLSLFSSSSVFRNTWIRGSLWSPFVIPTESTFLSSRQQVFQFAAVLHFHSVVDQFLLVSV